MQRSLKLLQAWHASIADLCVHVSFADALYIQNVGPAHDRVHQCKEIKALHRCAVVPLLPESKPDIFPLGADDGLRQMLPKDTDCTW